VKGTEAFPSSFFVTFRLRMNDANVLKKIEDFVIEITSQWETVFLVEIKIAPANEIKVFLDADDGVTIEKCTFVNKALYKYIEESGLFPDGNFSLEVSSPGIDAPLKLHRQYEKNIGRKIEVMLNDGNKVEGTLINLIENEIVLEEKTGKGNKTIIKTTSIFFNQIKHTKVLVTF
jgi:ribosome maturation factor RimP